MNFPPENVMDHTCSTDYLSRIKLFRNNNNNKRKQGRKIKEKGKKRI